MDSVNRDFLKDQLVREHATYIKRTQASARLFANAEHLLCGVPVTWMNKWAGGYPIHFSTAPGNRIVDFDGNEYIDFALGDTGAMAGHSSEATVRAVRDRIEGAGGITTMLPTDDAEWVAGDLSRRFRISLWPLSLTATDVNRWALRIARMATGRHKICAFSYCCHGAVDETLIRTGSDGSTIERERNVGPAVPVAQTSRGAEFDDLDSHGYWIFDPVAKSDQTVAPGVRFRGQSMLWTGHHVDHLAPALTTLMEHILDRLGAR